jgi:hypothetical protein
VEGGAAEDGRKPSVWDAFSHTPGKVQNGDTGDVANDIYHRYKQDFQLLKSLGGKGYRFSFAWPRVVPEGTGPTSEKGIAYYERLLDELAAAGIEPYATLFPLGSSPGSGRPLGRLAVSRNIQGFRGLRRVGCQELLRPYPPVLRN